MRLCKPQKLENGNKLLSRNMKFDATTVTLHEIYRVAGLLSSTRFRPIFAFSRNNVYRDPLHDL